MLLLPPSKLTLVLLVQHEVLVLLLHEKRGHGGCVCCRGLLREGVLLRAATPTDGLRRLHSTRDIRRNRERLWCADRGKAVALIEQEKAVLWGNCDR